MALWLLQRFKLTNNDRMEVELEIIELRRLLAAERTYRLKVEEERDFLLKDNDSLRQQINTGKSFFSSNLQSNKDKEVIVPVDGSNNSIVLTSKFDTIDSPIVHVQNACDGKNVICCNIVTHSREVPTIGETADVDIVLCGGVDNSVSAYTISGALLFKFPLPAPVIAMDSVNNDVACGMMDGSHSIFRLETAGDTLVAVAQQSHQDTHTDEDSNKSNSKAFERLHTKQVVVVKWSDDGQYLCTVSHDKHVILFRRSVITERMEVYQTIVCATTPESAAFVPASFRPAVLGTKEGGQGKAGTIAISRVDTTAEEPCPGEAAENIDDFVSQLLRKSQQQTAGATALHSQPDPQPPSETGLQLNRVEKSTGVQLISASAENAAAYTTAGVSSGGPSYELVIGMRDVAYLTYIHCDSLTSRTVSLNEHSWDTHASFTPLYLAPNPPGDRLLVATDKDMHIILRTGTNERLQVLSGHSCGGYGKPVVQWDARGEYVYCNSDDDNTVLVYSTTTGKIVSRLVGHRKGIVRSLAAHRQKNLVVSASYDKSVIVWGSKSVLCLKK